jgi:hypothetical protein
MESTAEALKYVEHATGLLVHKREWEGVIKK